MPSSYAHYRFGTQVLDLMPADIREPILRNRALFDAGLQGPDFLFFHSLFKTGPLSRLGTAYHEKSGREFFTNACRHLHRSASEPAFSYLHGLLAHYCLDSACHPFVYSVTENENLAHVELETEFDRYLLALDGCKKPHEASTSHSMKLQQCDIAAVCGFYPDVSPADMTRCVRNMALSHRLLALPTRIGRSMVEGVTRLAGGNAAAKVMTIGPHPKWSHLDEKLLELYQQALRKYPVHLEQLSSHMASGTPLGDAFHVNFNRG